MPQPLLILGTGPHAMEIIQIVAQINRVTPTWELLGLLALDSNPEQKNQIFNDLPVIGVVSEAENYPDAVFLSDYGACPPNFPVHKLTSLIAPGSFVSSTATIGRGTIIYPNCFIGHNAVIKERCFMLSGAVVNHDCFLEDDVAIGTHVSIAGGVRIETNCYLGQACTIRQNLIVGRDSLIGMGSVVIRDVLPNSVMAGNPARRIKARHQ